jgi:methylase of polypeptide subunit release factors
MSAQAEGSRREVIEFDGLTIGFDERVLRPRPWTAEQSRWAASLLSELPAGPVLELCAGAGQIGLAAVARTDRRLLCVEADPVAAGHAVDNARSTGLSQRVEVRQERMASALRPGEVFSLVIADPPWVRRDDTSRFPEDPLTAIDGGADGLDVARQCLVVIGRHLAPGGAALLQLGSTQQVAALDREVQAARLAVSEIRTYDGGTVARLQRVQAS